MMNPDKPETGDMDHFTPEEVLSRYAFEPAIKTAPVQIRPITERDIAVLGDTFRDLEGRVQRVEPGRFLCRGSQGEWWTCSAASMAERIAISEPDKDGFRWYRQRHPQPVLVAEISKPFTLTVYGETWTSQPDGGVVTWNGEHGDALIMRVIARSVFAHTYQRQTDQKGETPPDGEPSEASRLPHDPDRYHAVPPGPDASRD